MRSNNKLIILLLFIFLLFFFALFNNIIENWNLSITVAAPSKHVHPDFSHHLHHQIVPAQVTVTPAKWINVKQWLYHKILVDGYEWFCFVYLFFSILRENLSEKFLVSFSNYNHINLHLPSTISWPSSRPRFKSKLQSL